MESQYTTVEGYKQGYNILPLQRDTYNINQRVMRVSLDTGPLIRRVGTGVPLDMPNITILRWHTIT